MNAPIAIVLAAGKGTRMNSDLPKVLCQANGRPLVEYVLDSLRDAGVEKLIVVVGYKGDEVKQQLAKYENIEYCDSSRATRYRACGDDVYRKYEGS